MIVACSAEQLRERLQDVAGFGCGCAIVARLARQAPIDSIVAASVEGDDEAEREIFSATESTRVVVYRSGTKWRYWSEAEDYTGHG